MALPRAVSLPASIDEFLTVRDVSRLFKVNERTVYGLVLEGRIPARKVGRQWRLLRSEVERTLVRLDPPSPRRRLLVVQRDEYHRRLLKAILEAEGYEVVVAGGRNALTHLSPRVDAVVLDAGLPRDEGIRLLRMLQGAGRTPIPTLVLASDGAGRNGLQPEPLDRGRLLRDLSRLLEVSRNRRPIPRRDA